MNKQMYFDLTNGVYTVSHKKIYDNETIVCPLCKARFDLKLKGNDTHCGVKCKRAYSIVKVINSQ